MNNIVSDAFEKRGGHDLDKELEGTDYLKEVKQAVDITDLKKEQEAYHKRMVAADKPTRWRMAVDWLLKHNEQALFESTEILKEIKQIKLDAKNDYAAGKVMRQGMKIPGTVLDTIYLVDPDVSAVFESGKPEEKKAQLHKLMKVFPEYTVPKRI